VKSLVFVDGEEPVMVLCAGDRRVAADELGLRAASATEARAATGFAIGGIPPLGHDRDLRTIVDGSLRRYETVWCAAGTPHAVFEIETSALIDALAQATEIDVAHPPPRGTADWSIGRYEHVATGLLPAAQLVVDRAAPRPGEHVLDIGCGTGSAALLAAECGARVAGVDPAERLLDIGRGQAEARKLQVAFMRGTAEALPLADETVDVTVSAFGVVFATDPAAAARELARVTAPGGRLVFSAWIPSGAIFDVMTLRAEALAAAAGAPLPPPMSWHDPAALGRLLGPYGFAVDLEEHELAFSARSAGEFLDAELRDHPIWIRALQELKRHGDLTATRRRALAVLEGANEEADAFRVTSRYVIVSARLDDGAIAKRRTNERPERH